MSSLLGFGVRARGIRNAQHLVTVLRVATVYVVSGLGGQSWQRGAAAQLPRGQNLASSDQHENKKNSIVRTTGAHHELACEAASPTRLPSIVPTPLHKSLTSPSPQREKLYVGEFRWPPAMEKPRGAEKA
jgi:hypothetical protein